MNSEFSDHDLEEMLKTHPEDTLADSGFSHRVLMALPPARNPVVRKFARYRALLCTAAGAGVWLLSMPSLRNALASAEATQTELERLANLGNGLSSPEAIMALSVLVLCGSILFAFDRQDAAD